DIALADRLHAHFIRRYAEIGAGRSRVFPGGRVLLSHLAGAGARLAICTNKPAAVTIRVLDELELSSWFEAVVGETPALPRKPDPAMLLAALDWLDADPSDAVMIGDSAADITAARAARVRSIAVSFGYTTIPPAELGADALVAHLSEIPAVLARLSCR
ncbi:MAG: HAD family hydrolase, partial [Hyphomicrobiaceae bacterium]